MFKLCFLIAFIWALRSSDIDWFSIITGLVVILIIGIPFKILGKLLK